MVSVINESGEWIDKRCCKREEDGKRKIKLDRNI